MFAIEIETTEDEKDLRIAELWEAGSAGIVEDTGANGMPVLRAFFEDGRDSAELVGAFAARKPSLLRFPDEGWVELSRRDWRSFPVGRRFFIVPEWLDDPAPAGRLRIVINPGMAFGTGVHEATQLCMEALEGRMAPGCRVFDIGTGSGILSIAASLLGAGEVVACDEDPGAVAIANENFAAAGVSAKAIYGSIEAIEGQADVIVANISPEVTIALAPEILYRLAPGGVAIVSGFEEQERAEVSEALQAAGARVTAGGQKNTWVSLVYSKAGEGNGPRASSSRAPVSSRSSSS